MLLTLCLFLLGASLAVNAMQYRQGIALERAGAESRREAREATERLLAARKEGFEIPEPPQPMPEPEPPLTPKLQALVDDWETEVGRDAQRAVIRRHLAAGKSEAEILRLIGPVEGE